MSLSNDDDRMPYWFSKDQIDLLARSVGNNIGGPRDNGSLQFINDEIGVSLARIKTSPVRVKLARLFRATPYILMLSNEECEAVMNVVSDQEITEKVSHGIR